MSPFLSDVGFDQISFATPVVGAGQGVTTVALHLSGDSTSPTFNPRSQDIALERQAAALDLALFDTPQERIDATRIADPRSLDNPNSPAAKLAKWGRRAVNLINKATHGSLAIVSFVISDSALQRIRDYRGTSTDNSRRFAILRTTAVAGEDCNFFFPRHDRDLDPPGLHTGISQVERAMVVRENLLALKTDTELAIADLKSSIEFQRLSRSGQHRTETMVHANLSNALSRAELAWTSSKSFPMVVRLLRFSCGPDQFVRFAARGELPVLGAL